MSDDLSKGRCFGYSLSTVRDDARFQVKYEAAVLEVYEAQFASTHRWAGCFLDQKYTEAAALFARPAGAELLKQAARSDVVIFPHLDRGFKNLGDLMEALRRFRIKGVRLVIPEIGFDTLTGQDVVAMVEKLVEFDGNSRRRNFQEKIKDNWQEGKTTPGRRPPLGFSARLVGEHHYVIGDQAQRTLMGRMMEWADKGWTPAQIAHKLNSEGVTNPEEAPWNKVTAGHWVCAERVIRAYEASECVSMVGKICPADLREYLLQSVLTEIRQGKRDVPDFSS